MRPDHAHPTGARRRRHRSGAALVIVLAAALLTVLGISHLPRARAASSSRLRQQIAGGRRREANLAGTVRDAGRRIAQLGTSISVLSARLTHLQRDLDAKRAELVSLHAQLAASQTRLARLEATEAGDEQVLAAQLVGSYEGERPDIITVVLEATGFQDLLERLNFAQRISRQDTRITSEVRAARRAVAAEAIRLGALSARQQRVTDQVLAERNSVAQIRTSLVTQQLAVYRFRSSKDGQLAGVRSRLASLSSELSVLVADQRAAAERARRAAALRAAQQAAQQRAAHSAPVPSTAAPGPATPAPSAPSSGGFTFPMPISAAAPPSAWSPDDGVDISAPGGTPLLAVCSGTVVLHGIGGFGPSAPVIHCDSPLAGYDYVYYGHAGPGNWTPIGTHVSQGQVISQVGDGIVGISTGPHLELGFADSSGTPIGPSSAATMLSLLHSAY